MVTKQKETMLVFPLLDMFGCISNLSEACSTNSKKPLFGHYYFYPPHPPFPAHLARGENVVNAFQ